MLFKQATRENPTEIKESKKPKTFIKWHKKGNYGDFEEDILIYKIDKGKDDKITNRVFIGNPFSIGIAEVINNKINILTGIILLQDEMKNIYLVPHKQGRKVRVTKKWAYCDIRTLLAYVPILNVIAPYNDINEYKFKIDSILTEFIAIGPNIQGMKFKGYKLELIQKLNNNIQENELKSKIETDSINSNNEENLDEFDETDFEDFIV